ncbi:hypothetical protein SUGI_0594540 [Cryptomeria japonica]|nr:hypothetical protein SUGI_0594540 [Cryptomeria japonica]
MEITGQVVCSPLRAVKEQYSVKSEEEVGKQKSTKGGWKTMPFILGNESCANLALTSLHANLVVFLTTEYNKDRLTAAIIATIWGGSNLLSPLMGAYLADSYLGSGMKSSALAFGAEQFDNEDDGGRKEQERFFDWYFCIGTISIMVGLTLLVYIQSVIDWRLGFGLATILMIISTGFFLLGTKHYVKMSPEGSPLREYAQVMVASFRKRNLAVPSNPREFYGTHLEKGPVLNLYLTDQLNFFNRAAIIKKEDFEENGSEPNPWKLCTVKKIQELKSVISVLPVWSSGIVASFMLMGSSHTYMVYQALHMNRNLGSLLVPASSYIIFSMLATSIWLPLYERVVLPFFRRLTKREEGISVMERIGTGLVISVQAMTVAALVEVKRRQSSNPISAFWLGPQYTLIGLAEAFYAIGMIEFFYERFPKSMSSTAAALFWCSMGIGLLLNSVVFKVVHKATGESGKQAWLPENLDQGHLEYYYCFCVGLGVLNFIYFLVCSRGVKYVETDGKNIITKGKEGRLEFSA